MSNNRVDYRIKETPTVLSSDELNSEYGVYGYDLVSILPLTDGFQYVFKRVDTSANVSMRNFSGKDIDAFTRALGKATKEKGKHRES